MMLRSAVVMAVLMVGCTASRVQRDQLASVRKIGILSVTIDRMGNQLSDVQVLERVTTASADRYASQLSQGGTWEVMPLAGYQDHPAFRDFSTPSRSAIFREVVEEQAQNGEVSADGSLMMAALAARMSGDPEKMKQVGASAVDGLVRQLDMLVEQQRQAYVGAPGLVFVPYSILKPQGASQTKVVYSSGTQKKEPEEQRRDVVLKAIGRLAATLGLDAFAIAYHHTDLAGGGTRVFVGDRGLDTVRMATAVIIVNRDGKAAVDTGFPSIDGLSHSRLAVPVYRKVGARDREVDLNDPAGNVGPALEEMAVETGRALVADVQKELASN